MFVGAFVRGYGEDVFAVAVTILSFIYIEMAIWNNVALIQTLLSINRILSFLGIPQKL